MSAELLTPTEIARRLGVSYTTLRKKIREAYPGTHNLRGFMINAGDMPALAKKLGLAREV